MDTNQLNRWLTLGANIGVLIGIVLLIVELDQNRDMIQAQTRNDISWQVTDFLTRVASDRDFSSLKYRAELGEELSAEEESRYFYHFSANLRIWENIHYQYRQGMFDDSEFNAAISTWRWLISVNKRFVPIWCQSRQNYSPEFMHEI